ncbi:MAG: hypothetical protein P4N59_11230 [Negativicutes bacterium]|nr:hypothetical protein [Negativicutes bacterium]
MEKKGGKLGQNFFKLLKTHIEKMPVFRLSMILMKTNELNHSFQDITEKKGVSKELGRKIESGVRSPRSSRTAMSDGKKRPSPNFSPALAVPVGQLMSQAPRGRTNKAQANGLGFEDQAIR